MKKLTITIVLLAAISGFYFSCENSFEDLPLDYNQLEDIYADSSFVVNFVNDMYLGLPDGYNRLDGTSMISSTTDESVEGGNGTQAEQMALGIWSAASPQDNSWSFNYQYIRKSNIFLNEIIPGIPEGLFYSTGTIDILEGQARFFRVLQYFELLKRYGGIPLIREVLDLDGGSTISRATYDECVQFIVGECDKIINESLLPIAWANANNDFGRLTIGAVHALKSRTLLYAASPLFNDPANATNTIEHGAFDNTKWELAAAAAHAVIVSGEYSLHPNFVNLFTQLNNNDEIILSRIDGQNNTVEQQNGPTGFTGGQGGAAPTLDLVEAFRMSDGSAFDWNNPTHAEDPFSNREPRFDATILYNGRTWFGRPIETYAGGIDLGNVNSTKTGFYLRKFMGANAAWFGGSKGQAFHCFPIFRYGEILLNYAESMNEAFGPDNNAGFTLTAKEALDQVRNRGGLGNLPIGLSKEAFRSEVRLERRIELAFEEHRHLDLRRWKVDLSDLNDPVRGLKITKNPDDSFTYERFYAQNRVFRPEMYLYPIPKADVDRNTNLDQNLNW